MRVKDNIAQIGFYRTLSILVLIFSTLSLSLVSSAQLTSEAIDKPDEVRWSYRVNFNKILMQPESNTSLNFIDIQTRQFFMVEAAGELQVNLEEIYEGETTIEKLSEKVVANSLVLNSFFGPLDYRFSNCRSENEILNIKETESFLAKVNTYGFRQSFRCAIVPKQIFEVSGEQKKLELWVSGGDQRTTESNPVEVFYGKGLSSLPALSTLFLAVIATVLGILLPLFYFLSQTRRKRDREKFERIIRHEKDIISETRDLLQENETLVDINIENIEIPDELINAITSRKCILTLGAGASAQAGYPSGVKLLQELVFQFNNDLPAHVTDYINELVDRPASPQSSTDFSVAMESILSYVPREDLEEKIQTILDDVKPNGKFHKQLDRFDWRGVVSLVWDDFAENTMAHNSSDIFTIEDGKKLQGAIRFQDNFFIRALGSFDNSRSLTWYIEDFRQNVSNAPDFRRQFLSLAQSNSLLFVGVGIQTIKSFFEALDFSGYDSSIRHWAIVPYSAQNNLFGSVLKRYGIELIEYSRKDEHAQLPEFISRLRNKTKTSVFGKNHSNKSKQKETTKRISELSLKNIGPFKNLTVDFNSGSGLNDSSNWTVLMGPNGSGKSVIMRALSLALCANDSRAGKIAKSLLKYGEKFGEITLKLIDGDAQEIKLRVGLTRDEGRGRVQIEPYSVSPLESGQLLALGFPALRGAPSRDPIGPKKTQDTPVGPDDLFPLLEGGIDDRMDDFKQWIVNILSQSKEDKKSGKIRKLLEDIIAELVPGEFDGFDDIGPDFKIRLKQVSNNDPNSIELLEFGSISQGMASIFNWLGVLIQRLYIFYGQESEALKAPNTRKAILLVDEIDAHLHPEWQRKLVKITKKYFPNVQLIVSSHSVLMAGALYRDEIRIIEHDQTGNSFVISKPKRETFGLSSRELFSQVFEMRTDRNPTVEKKIDEYNILRQISDENKTKDERTRYNKIVQQLEIIDYAGVKKAQIDDWVKPSPDEFKGFFSSINENEKDEE